MARTLEVSAESQPYMIVGGEVRPERLASLVKATGLTIEWVESRAPRAVQAAAARIAAGGVAGVALMPAFASHGATEAVRAAARAGGVPYAHVSSCGTASLREALRRLADARLVLPRFVGSDAETRRDR